MMRINLNVTRFTLPWNLTRPWPLMLSVGRDIPIGIRVGNLSLAPLTYAFGAGAYVLRYRLNESGQPVVIWIWHTREWQEV